MTFKSVSYAIWDQVLVSGTNFLFSIVLARAFTQEEFGLYLFSFTTLVLAIAFLNAVLCGSISVLLAPYEGDELREYIWNFFLLFCIISLGLSFSLFVASLLLDKTSFSSNASALRDISFILFAFLGQDYFRRILLSKLMVFDVFIVDILTYVPRIVVLFVFYSQLTTGRIIYLFGLTSVFGIFYALYRIRSHFHGEKVIKREIWMKIWHYGKWTLAEWVPFVVSGQLYVYVVTFMLGNASNGLLGACNNLVAPVVLLLVSIMNYGLPYYSNLFNKAGQWAVVGSMKKIFAALGVMVSSYLIAVTVFADHIFEFLNPAYLGNSRLVGILGIAVFFTFLFKPADIYFKVKLLPRIVFICRIITAFISSISVFLFIKLYGVYGAALSYFVSQFVMCILLYYFMFKDLKNVANIIEPQCALSHGAQK